MMLSKYGVHPRQRESTLAIVFLQNISQLFIKVSAMRYLAK
jgi:hypothetical protein